MTDNPYVPPSDHSLTSPPEIVIGDFVVKVKSREVSYVVCMGVGLIKSVLSYAESGSPYSTAVLAMLALLLFRLHCQTLLQTQGAVRIFVIIVNVCLLLAGFLNPNYALGIFVGNAIVHGLVNLAVGRRAAADARHISSLLNSADPVSAIQQEIAKKGDTPIRIQALAYSYGKRQQWAEALDVMWRGLRQEPKHAALHISMTSLLGDSGDHAAAEDAYTRLRNQPLDVMTKLQIESNYCRFLVQTRRFEECRSKLQEIRQILSSMNKVAKANIIVLETSLQKTEELLAQTTSSPEK